MLLFVGEDSVAAIVGAVSTIGIGEASVFTIVWGLDRVISMNAGLIAIVAVTSEDTIAGATSTGDITSVLWIMGVSIGLILSAEGVGILTSIELVSASAWTVGAILGAFAAATERASVSGPNTISSEDFCMNIGVVLVSHCPLPCWDCPLHCEEDHCPLHTPLSGSKGGFGFIGFLRMSSNSHIEKKVKKILWGYHFFWRNANFRILFIYRRYSLPDCYRDKW
jgi:hypothetical protein